MRLRAFFLGCLWLLSLDESHSFSAPLSAGGLPRKKNAPPKRKKKKSLSPRDTANNQSRWLRWIYHRLQENPTGMLPKVVMNQMGPAMAAWARRTNENGAERAQELLERYIEEFKAGNSLAALDLVHFNSVMDAWAKTRRRDSPQKVYKLLEMMRKLRNDHDQVQLSPDMISLSILVAAWAKSREKGGAEKALQLLELMENNDLGPTSKTYNSVLLALVHSQFRDKALRVQEIIDRMTRRSKEGHKNCSPDLYSYQSLIAAWSRTALAGTPQKAEEVLRFLDDKARKDGEKHLSPNRYCYTATIHAWSNSLEREKFRRAYQILHHMRERSLEEKDKNLSPNVVTCTAVLNACASPVSESEREEALAVARLVMEEMKYCGYGRPNFLTYAAFLRVLATTLEPGDVRDFNVEDVFGHCCTDGQVGLIVLDKLRIAASPKLYEEIVGPFTQVNEDGTQFLKIPAFWERNVEGERDPSVRHYNDQLTKVTSDSYEQLQQVRGKQGVPGPYSKCEKRYEIS